MVSDPDFSAVDWSGLPNIITLAVRLSVAHKTRTRFVQIRVAISAFEAAGVPFQVGCYAENVLVLNLRAAADTHGYSTLLCKRNTKQNLRAPWSKAWQEILLSVQESHRAEVKFILTSGESHGVKYIRWRSWSVIPKEATQDTLGDINQNGITNWATLPADEPNTSKFRSLWRGYAIGASSSHNATWSALSLSGSLLAGGSTTNFTNWYPVVNAKLFIGRPPFITCQTLRVFLDLKQR